MAPLLFLYASRIILIVPVIASTIAALILQCGGGSKKKNSKNTKKVVVGQPLWKNAIPNDRVDPRKREYQTLFGLRNEQIFPAKRTKEPLKKKKGKKHIMQRRNDSPMKGDDPEKAEYSKSEKEKSGRAVPNTDRDRPDANDDYAALENLSVTKPGEQADWKDNKTGDSEKKKEGFGDLDAYGTLKDIQHDDIFLSKKR